MRTTLLLFIILVSISLVTSCNETPLNDGVVAEEEEAIQQDFFLEQGALLGMHFAIHKEGTSLPESRNFLRYDFFPAWKDLCPGSKVFYLRPDRGQHIGREGFFWVFQDEEARNVYFPQKDFPTEEFENRRASVNWLYTDSTFFKYFKFGMNTSGYSSDYEVIAMHDSVDKEWLTDDAIVMIQHLPLLPETDTLEFENFLTEEWAKRQSKTGSNTVKAFLKVTRGYKEGEFAQLWVFDSMQERNKFFPYEGKPDEEKPSTDSPVEQKLKTFIDLTQSDEEHYEIIY